MKSLKSLIIAALIVVAGMSRAWALDPENTLYLDLPWGRVVIEMLPDLAPNHVARIKELVRKGFYDGTPFHRVFSTSARSATNVSVWELGATPGSSR